MYEKAKKCKDVAIVHHPQDDYHRPYYDHFNFQQMIYHLGMAWDLRWRTCQDNGTKFCLLKQNVSPEPLIPSVEQVFSVPELFMA